MINPKNYFKYKRLRSQKRKTRLKSKSYNISTTYYYSSYLSIIIKSSFIYFILFHIYNSPYRNKQLISKKIADFENNLHNVTEEEIQEFRKINSEKILLDNSPITKSIYPDISVIVTLHNQAHCIHKCIRSIQNQSIKNLEIIFVDDCSTDNSTEVVEEFQKQDKRIIILKHDSNEGPIKSRTDGVLLAKGKYITIVDGDDSFSHKNILYNSLTIAKIGKIDVVEFKSAYYRKNKFKEIVNSYQLINITGVIYQPELRTKFFIICDNDAIRAIQSRSIWAKLIKNEVFQKAIINIGPKYTDDCIMQYEDTIMAVAIYQVAKSYYLMKEMGYYYSRDEFRGRFPPIKNKTCKRNHKIRDMGHVKLLQFLVEKTANNQVERQMIYHEIFSIDHYLSLLYIIYHNYEMVYEVLDPMIESPFLTESQKVRLKKLKEKLMKKQNKKLI